MFTRREGGPLLLHEWALTTGAQPRLSLAASGTSLTGYRGSLPIATSNGRSPNTGVVWLIDRANRHLVQRRQLQPGPHPLTANGRVYASCYQVVQVFGLIP